MTLYEVCIIGAGMVGSAAARHATLMRNDLSVCLIGPEEPKDRATASIFGAYYDEARLTRQSAPDPLWGTMAVESIKRYRQLEQMAGVQFYQEVGCLIVARPEDDLISSSIAFAKSANISLEALSADSACRRFPYLNISDQFTCLYEATEAGYINPRRLVKAEQKLAAKGGVTIIREVVEEVVTLLPNQNSNSIPGVTQSFSGGDREIIMDIRLESDRHIFAKKVLLATGAFTNLRKLLPVGANLDVQLTTQVVTFGEVGRGDAAKLSRMPSILWEGYNHGDHKSPEGARMIEGCYILPPVLYPDGKYYIKIGHGSQFEQRKRTEKEVKDWYCQPVSAEVEKAQELWLRDIFPDVNFLSFRSDQCLITLTPTYRPYVDTVTPSLGVAIGGNGYAAKSCDEFGRMGIELLLNNGRWTHRLPADWFKLRIASRI